MTEPCYLYLISPPQLELEAFSAQLRAALGAGKGVADAQQSSNCHPAPVAGSGAVNEIVGEAPDPGMRRDDSAEATNLIGAFQLRLKDPSDIAKPATDDQIIEAAKALLPICQEYEVAFIMNDRPDLAKQLGCDGVHLGQEDLAEWPVARMRELLGEEAILGVSCHDSKHLAMDAAAAGADYVAFGAFHPTQSKAPEKLAKYGTPTTEILEWWSIYTEIPCVAIGGMTPENCTPMVKAGADFIAAITSVWGHPDGAGAAVEGFAQALL